MEVVLDRSGSQISIQAVGLRNARFQDMTLTVGGLPARILYAGPHPAWEYNDLLTFELGPEHAGMGETDLLLIAAGQVSNAVRIQVDQP